MMLNYFFLIFLNLLLLFFYLSFFCIFILGDILIITARSVLNINPFVILIFDNSFWSFIFIELKFNFLLEHNSSTGSVSICNFVLALISIMTIFKTPLTANYSRSLRRQSLFFHSIIIFINFQEHKSRINKEKYFFTIKNIFFC